MKNNRCHVMLNQSGQRVLLCLKFFIYDSKFMACCIIWDSPEFYSENLLMNTKTHKIYNSKFVLRVLDLTQLEYVSEEEKESDLYYWAKLFKATSWEEITMLAEKNEAIREAATTIKQLNADEKIKIQCEARERLEHDMASAYQHGVDVGEKLGIEQGEARLTKLLQILTTEGKNQDINKVIMDQKYREELYQKYSL